MRIAIVNAVSELIVVQEFDTRAEGRKFLGQDRGPGFEFLPIDVAADHTPRAVLQPVRSAAAQSAADVGHHRPREGKTTHEPLVHALG